MLDLGHQGRPEPRTIEQIKQNTFHAIRIAICEHLLFPSGPLPPQNLSLSHVTTNSALITWNRHPRNIPDGFVVNVTRGLNTRSRFLPNGKLGSYTLRELTPGQHYYLALTAVKNTGQEQIHSIPQHLAFTTCESLCMRNYFSHKPYIYINVCPQVDVCFLSTYQHHDNTHLAWVVAVELCPEHLFI